MNTTAIIPKINLQGSTANEPLITFIQNNNWNSSNNFCLLSLFCVLLTVFIDIQRDSEMQAQEV